MGSLSCGQDLFAEEEAGFIDHQQSTIKKMYRSYSAMVIVLLSLVSICLAAPFSTMDSDAEHIHAYNGFYGNPIYRPYGFGSWGFDRQDLEKRCWRPAGQTPSMEDIPRIKKI